ncbi:hypothetical protein CO110_00035 [Candidatus Desantisbacteria bacterium CG_4_9_14_3_um_filter_40_11]|uniref:Uncharacterized protein n=3 Tax=unclassified Candidatus Desantisiibacteriota TaxID=3106372 RepID=A0A2M7JE64_9BACT|nr:MAG: hypothetical protein COX18_07735 [Candidatus Desantisbacteria bacterium CG23_combo_of_CG06-09_8_20_14_all_40_23]PIX17691.1 MAG: hypothetical protein COZ71_02025 [Candidatus Desantisbacteria bacterium CG_4_8_14_3_um_filter_40_12]PJB30528.1 MAG: hypothetical protein CO110_00035 [Candidatus Desantisbacteria bacterium CG_4_9_14_3_um_filter_40_11]
MKNLLLGRKKQIAILLLLIGGGIATAAGLIAANASKNAGPVVASNSSTSPVVEEETTAPATAAQKLENKGTIYVSCESDEATIFLLREKNGRYEKIKEVIGSTVFSVDIGYKYKIMAKKEKYLTWTSQEINIDTPEQEEEVIARMKEDPNIPIEGGDEVWHI